MTGYSDPRPAEGLAVRFDGRVILSPDLWEESRKWGLFIEGKTRQQAVEYLLEQVASMRSDGMHCAYMDYGDPPRGRSCLCARSLMMLHDISPQEVSVAMFDRLITILAGMGSLAAIEVLSYLHDESNFEERR